MIFGNSFCKFVARAPSLLNDLFLRSTLRKRLFSYFVTENYLFSNVLMLAPFFNFKAFFFDNKRCEIEFCLFCNLP